MQKKIAEDIKCTVVQKATHLELMFGQIANFSPIIFRNMILKKFTIVSYV